jgi:hypothetical protein
VLCGCEASEQSQQRTTKNVSIVSTEFLHRNIFIFVNDKDWERRKKQKQKRKNFVAIFVEQ